MLVQDRGQKKGSDLEVERDKSPLEKFQDSLENYNKALSSNYVNERGKAPVLLKEVEATLKKVLGLPDSAQLELKLKDGALMGTLSFDDSRGKPLKVSIGIDSADGSVVVGKPFKGETYASSFTMGVRIEPDVLKEKFEKIQQTLSILPKEVLDRKGNVISEGFTVVGFTDSGEAIATSADSSPMTTRGSKDHLKGKIAIVNFGPNGPEKISPETVVVTLNEKQNKILLATIKDPKTGEGKLCAIDPFPALIDKRKEQLMQRIRELMRDPEFGKGVGIGDLLKDAGQRIDPPEKP